MTEGIVARAKLGGRKRGQREFRGVEATVQVTLPVVLDLFEDGGFTVRNVKGNEEDRSVQVPLPAVESAVEDTYSDEDLAAAYEDAMALNLDPDSAAEEEDDDDRE